VRTPLDTGSGVAAARADQPAGGVRATSFALVDQVRALDRSRLALRWGAIDPATHRQIAALRLRILAPR